MGGWWSNLMEKVEQDAILAAEMVGGLGLVAFTAPLLASPSGFASSIGVAGLGGALFLGYDGYQRWEDRDHSVEDSFVTLRGPLEMLGGSYLVYKGVNFFFDSQGLSSNSLKTFDLALGAVFVSGGGYVMWDGWKHWGDKPYRKPIGTTDLEAGLATLFDKLNWEADECRQLQVGASDQLMREGYKYGQTPEEQDQWNQLVRSRLPEKCRNPVYEDGVLQGYRQSDGSLASADSEQWTRVKVLKEVSDCMTRVRINDLANNTGKADYAQALQRMQWKQCVSKDARNILGISDSLDDQIKKGAATFSR